MDMEMFIMRLLLGGLITFGLFIMVIAVFSLVLILINLFKGNL